MEFKDFKERLFNRAKELNFEKYELYYGKSESLNITSSNGEVERYGLSTSIGVSFRGIYNGKMGYSYTEKLDEESIEILLLKAMECAELIESKDEEFILGDKAKYLEVNSYDENISNLTPKEQIEKALKLSTEPSKINSEIIKSEYTKFNTAKLERVIVNSEGIDLKEEKTIVQASISPIAKDGENMIVDGVSRVSTKLNDVNIDELMKKAINNTLRKKGATSIKSGKYKVIIDGEVMASLIRTMEDNFLGHIAQENKTLLKDKIGEKVASNKVTLVDDPFLKGGISTCSFDDEGVPTRVKNIIENGVFKGFLHSLKTAKKSKVNPTGNGFKSGFKSTVKASPTNLYIKEGEKSFEELLSYVENGIYIIDLAGLHSGANAVTGDFSLAAEGIKIENGVLTRAIKHITIAGNFFDLLNNIEEVGNDLEESGVTSGYGSPSIIIKELSVAGE
ncbi:TldD/PmbA family protein [Clostridium perfringens]|uniref:TldD/PmbA family protein n=1 Tax=Clostridium perfringens TaxID=1502 RepID=UPI0039E8145A|nr:TldD/PmbA family protein [Clostridium perfringens]